jgi:ABC-type polysaccharide/polyol phosphate transport system ATPase subunit
MSYEPVIDFQGVCKSYRLGTVETIRRFFTRSRAEEKPHEVWALRDVTFSVRKGEVFGIIGPNGAGKSTILKLLAGVTTPDRGTVNIVGRIAPLIELGAGFHPDLSGKENVYLNGALLGLSRREIDEMYDSIVAFAELEEFMDTPVKRYSSGMFIRLGFSLAVHTNPEILLVDEVLSVGDERFQRKCLRKFLQFREAGKTIVVVSHDLGLVSGICSNMLLLAHGRVVSCGSVDGAIGRYLQMMGEGDGVGVLQILRMTLLFNSGRTSLFSHGQEITKKLGLYTSMLIKRGEAGVGIWYDSTRAVWTCSASDGLTLRCRGEYISVPVVQECEFKFDERGAIYWRVWLDVLEPLQIERRQANIMLAERYHNWSTDEGHGAFPQEFTSRDYHNWEILNTSSGSHMSAQSSERLPLVTFRSRMRGYTANIVNSNFFFSGRVLMFLALETKTFQPGRYLYFDGELILHEP